jgi:hypothetical protein
MWLGSRQAESGRTLFLARRSCSEVTYRAVQQGADNDVVPEASGHGTLGRGSAPACHGACLSRHFPMAASRHPSLVA